uniref:F-box domain-containing protein n=1 Tax=Aegilops tauschii subsp. strangulata TaxID=200361 RepID=A0A453CR06_AEGTS
FSPRLMNPLYRLIYPDRFVPFSGAMEGKSSAKKKKVRTTNPPAEEAVTAAAASLLTEDLILEILSRLPARSVHRFKCVSPAWRDLIADPAHRKKLPQPLAGFLYSTYHGPDHRFYNFHFAKVPGGAAQPVDPSLSFLPSHEYWYVDQLDTCNGLLLCRAHKFPSSPSGDDDDPLEYHYIVCNPATGRWVGIPALPPVPAGRRVIARLAFDPAVPSHFHVLQFEDTEQDKYITGVTIYSSQTGAWNYRESRLPEKISLFAGLTSVFFQGMLHLYGLLYPVNTDYDAVLVAVDMEGKVWKTIGVPSGGLSFGLIGVSQRCLHYAATPLAPDDKKKKKKRKKKTDEDTTTVWYMKDYDSKEWVLKHSVSYDELRSMTGGEYRVAAFHPDCDTIFLDSFDADTLSSYDMQHRKFHRIRSLRKNKAAIFLPYVPLFSDSFAGVDRQ